MITTSLLVGTRYSYDDDNNNIINQTGHTHYYTGAYHHITTYSQSWW